MTPTQEEYAVRRRDRRITRRSALCDLVYQYQFCRPFRKGGPPTSAVDATANGCIPSQAPRPEHL
jgi:hypothetical protein